LACSSLWWSSLFGAGVEEVAGNDDDHACSCRQSVDADLKKLLPTPERAPDNQGQHRDPAEDQLRQQVTQDVAAKSGRYDLFTIGTYEVPLWAKKGWIENLSPFIAKDSSYDAADLIPESVGRSATTAISTRCPSMASRRCSCTARTFCKPWA